MTKLEGGSTKKSMTNSRFSGKGNMLRNINKRISSGAYLTEEPRSYYEEDEKQDLEEEEMAEEGNDEDNYGLEDDEIDVTYGYESIPDVNHRFEAPSPIIDRFASPYQIGQPQDKWKNNWLE